MNDSEISKRIAELRSEIEKLEQMRSLNKWNDAEEAREKRSQAYQIAKQEAEKNGEFIKNYLCIGQFVKVTGSRSKNKFRKIVKTRTLNGFCGQHLEVAKDIITGNVLPVITTHAYSKITHVYHEGKWLKTKDYIAELNRLVA